MNICNSNANHTFRNKNEDKNSSKSLYFIHILLYIMECIQMIFAYINKYFTLLKTELKSSIALLRKYFVNLTSIK